MNDIQKNKIEKFINDKVLAEAVYAVLLESFLTERKQQDVYVLAASRLAIDFLKQGWKELEKMKQVTDEQSTTTGNIGM